jgi:hypothetical protein
MAMSVAEAQGRKAAQRFKADSARGVSGREWAVREQLCMRFG